MNEHRQWLPSLELLAAPSRPGGFRSLFFPLHGPGMLELEVMMSTVLAAPPLPFTRDADGALRVTGSRVLAETVVRAFRDGATPEAISQRYPTAGLADVYAVIAYYLSHRLELDSYLAEREQEAVEIRGKIEAGQKDLTELRQRLAARRRLGQT